MVAGRRETPWLHRTPRGRRRPEGELGGYVQLPTQLAHVGAAHGDGPGVARSISWRVPNGKASLDRSASVSGATMLRASGPKTPRTAQAEVTSVTVMRASSGVWRAIQSASLTWVEKAVTTRKRSSSRRLTVRSASMPPRSFSHVVYTDVPGSTSTSADEIRFSTVQASGPWTSSLASEVWSNSAAPSRHARCSAAEYSNQFWRPYVYS